MRKDIFELVKYDSEKAILKVKDVDNLMIAEHPYISAEMDYITITRGRNHRMTVINKDGSTWGVSWGDSGCTLCSDSVNDLKWAARDFFEKDCFIPLDLMSENYSNATIFYNSNFGSWQLQLEANGKRSNMWFRDCYTVNDVMKKAINYIGETLWEPRTAPTGIATWVAKI